MHRRSPYAASVERGNHGSSLLGPEVLHPARSGGAYPSAGGVWRPRPQPPEKLCIRETECRCLRRTPRWPGKARTGKPLLSRRHTHHEEPLPRRCGPAAHHAGGRAGAAQVLGKGGGPARGPLAGAAASSDGPLSSPLCTFALKLGRRKPQAKLKPKENPAAARVQQYAPPIKLR
jgi:hypothetical protein